MDKDTEPTREIAWVDAQKKYLEAVSRFYTQVQQAGAATASRSASPASSISKTLPDAWVETVAGFLSGEWLSASNIFGLDENLAPSELFEKLSGLPSPVKNPERGEDIQSGVKLWNEYQQAYMNYNARLAKASVLAVDKLRDRLFACGLSGKEITTLRQFHDLWVESQEEAYAEIVFTEEHSQNFAALINSFMAVRQYAGRHGDRLPGMFEGI